MFERLRQIEARLTRLERTPRSRPRRVTARAAAEDRALAARDRALARRKAERDEAEAAMVKLEPLSGGRISTDSFAVAQRILNGDDW